MIKRKINWSHLSGLKKQKSEFDGMIRLNNRGHQSAGNYMAY